MGDMTHAVCEMVACDCEAFFRDHAGQVPGDARGEPEGFFDL